MADGYREQVSRNQVRFGAIAQSYAGGQARRLQADLLAELIRSLDFERALDMATGTGAAAAVVAKAGAGATIVGVDSSIDMLRQARAEVSGVRLVVGLAEELPFADGAFDLVLCTRALHQVEHPGLVVAEMARVLGPFGHVIVADNVTGLSGAAHEEFERIQRVRDPGHATTLRENQIVELLRGNGLDMVECRRTTSFRPLDQWLDDGGAGPAEAAEVRRRFAALGRVDDDGFGTNVVVEDGEITGLRQAMSWIRARRSGQIPHGDTGSGTGTPTPS
ncbi:methyltransferase family protein [Nocardia tenerifensis]|uniref:Methyltransferase family protein n=1 Tax=Nocardia tenerifensis TaxID=228006 RepID=A0A318JQC5_9NOCA|nr:methyltransferase domain-containing protein [Nocardia tenerifensis]PXX55587.1 methyltransferase family protein [Nocardia tenerifensis]